jgi:hypothetical protein
MNMPLVLNAVGDEVRGDHYYLPATAQCFYWGEYTPYEQTQGKRADFSPTNRLISNLKKRMSRQGASDWRYKQQAIVKCSMSFALMWKKQQLIQEQTMFVPMPPSRARGDADYDPRIVQVLNALSRPGRQLDIRDCLSFDGRYVASHDTDARPGPDELYAALHFDSGAGRPAEPPEAIVLFDDMLTTGAHFVAASRKIAEVWPDVPIVGYFVARRVLPNAANIFGDFDFI